MHDFVFILLMVLAFLLMTSAISSAHFPNEE